MEGIILLNANENTAQIEEEEKGRFVRTILENIGLPIEPIWKDDEQTLSVDDRIKLRTLLSKFGVSVIGDVEGTLKIYVDNEVVASWERPIYKLKRDYNEVDPQKRMYLEMTIKNWSVFEPDNNGK